MSQGHFAVVVGINGYPGFRSLNQARGDAEEFARWLKDPAGGGLPANHVELIQDPVGGNATVDTAVPTKSQIDQALGRFRQEIRTLIDAGTVAWDQTRLYLYFSGHGVTAGTRDAMVLMANADAENLGHNLSCDLYRESLERGQIFRELVFFADCCREHNVEARPGGPIWTEKVGNNGQVVVAIGYATGFGDLAFEEDPKVAADHKRGYFTRALLEGLRGKDESTIPGINEINSSTLAAYVQRRVKELTAHLRVPQEPWINTAPGTPIVLRRGMLADTFQVILRFRNFAGRFRLLDGGLNPIGPELDASTGPVTLRLPSSLYQIEAAGHSFDRGGLFAVRGKDLDETF